MHDHGNGPGSLIGLPGAGIHGHFILFFRVLIFANVSS